MSVDHLKKLIANNKRRLQVLREREALFGFSVDPSIILEISMIEERIDGLQKELSALEDHNVNVEDFPITQFRVVEDANSRQRIQIYMSDDFASLPSGRQFAAIRAFADVIGISPQQVEVYRIYNVQVNGELSDYTLQLPKTSEHKTPTYSISIISDITAVQPDDTIKEEDILDYVNVSDDLREDSAYFGVGITSDNMTGDGILPGDIALIRQQPTVKNGEVAAIVIRSPEIETLGVLKRYYVVHEGRKDLAHWLLSSSNPSGEHLIVMPRGADIEAIKSFYIKKIKREEILVPIKLYKDASISIAGKYIGVLRRKS